MGEIEVFSGLQTLGTHSAKPGCLGVPVNWEPAKRWNSSLNLTHFDGWRLFIFLENPAPGRLLPLSRVQTEWPCVNGLPTKDCDFPLCKLSNNHRAFTQLDDKSTTL